MGHIHDDGSRAVQLTDSLNPIYRDGHRCLGLRRSRRLQNDPACAALKDLPGIGIPRITHQPEGARPSLVDFKPPRRAASPLLEARTPQLTAPARIQEAKDASGDILEHLTTLALLKCADLMKSPKPCDSFTADINTRGARRRHGSTRSRFGTSPSVHQLDEQTPTWRFRSGLLRFRRQEANDNEHAQYGQDRRRASHRRRFSLERRRFLRVALERLAPGGSRNRSHEGVLRRNIRSGAEWPCSHQGERERSRGVAGVPCPGGVSSKPDNVTHPSDGERRDLSSIRCPVDSGGLHLYRHHTTDHFLPDRQDLHVLDEAIAGCDGTSNCPRLHASSMVQERLPHTAFPGLVAIKQLIGDNTRRPLRGNRHGRVPATELAPQGWNVRGQRSGRLLDRAACQRILRVPSLDHCLDAEVMYPGRDDYVTETEILRRNATGNADDQQPFGCQIFQEIAGRGLRLSISLLDASQHSHEVGPATWKGDPAQVVLPMTCNAFCDREAREHRFELILSDGDDAAVDLAFHISRLHRSLPPRA